MFPKILIFLATLASGIAICPKLNPVQNFDLKKFAGSWKLHAQITVISGSGAKFSEQDMIAEAEGFKSGTSYVGNERIVCMNFKIESDNWDSDPVEAVFVHHTDSVTPDGGSSSTESAYPLIIPDLKNPGAWLVDHGDEYYAHTVLYADSNYSLIAMCTDINFEKEIQFGFLSKSSSPMPLSVLKQFIAIVSELNLNGTASFEGVYLDENQCDY